MLREVAAEQTGESQFVITKTTCEVPPHLLAPSRVPAIARFAVFSLGSSRCSEMSDYDGAIVDKC